MMCQLPPKVRSRILASCRVAASRFIFISSGEDCSTAPTSTDFKASTIRLSRVGQPKTNVRLSAVTSLRHVMKSFRALKPLSLSRHRLRLASYRPPPPDSIILPIGDFGVTGRRGLREKHWLKIGDYQSWATSVGISRTWACRRGVEIQVDLDVYWKTPVSEST